jgi:hypothetical protein
MMGTEGVVKWSLDFLVAEACGLSFALAVRTGIKQKIQIYIQFSAVSLMRSASGASPESRVPCLHSPCFFSPVYTSTALVY